MLLINTMSCPIKVNSNTTELTVCTSCYCVLDLLSVNVVLCEVMSFVFFFQTAMLKVDWTTSQVVVRLPPVFIFP